MKMIARAAMLAAVSLCAFSQAQIAFAQTATPDAADEADAGGADIVVTAQRRSENVRDVPISVGVIDGNGLRDYQAAGADTLLSLSGKVPSLYVESTTGRIFPRFYIRGLGNIDFYLGASQPVSIIHDDVVLEHVVLKSNPAFDIAQVEVLRGPQGSLFGRNTTAGIVKFDTAQPTKTAQGQISASWGTHNSINVDAGIGGPVTDDGRISVRFSALYQHRDNFIDNTFAGTSADGTRTPQKNAMGRFDERDVRAQVLFEPTDALSVRWSSHFRDYEGTSTLFYRGSITKGSNAVPANFDITKVALDEGNNNPQAYQTFGHSLNVAYDFGGVTLTSITAVEGSHGYSRGDTDGGAAANFGGVGFGQSQGRLRKLRQWTQELRLASSDTAQFKWQVGGIFFDARDMTEFDQRAYFLTGAANNPNNNVLLRNVNTAWGIFGQASYDFTDKLTLTAGIRESGDLKKTYLLRPAANAAGVSTYAGRTYVRLYDSEPSWDVSLLYKITPDVNVYARVARGFRGPTIQGRSAVFNADFTTATSETNTSYEVGVKTAFLDNAVHFDLSGFYYEVKNIQLNGNDSNGNGVLFNADKAKGYGLEAQLDVRPVQGLRLNAGLSLLHTEIDDKRVYAQVCALSGVVVCTVQDPTIKIGANTFAQIDGNPLPNAPRYNLNLSARYDLPLGPGRAFVSTDWNMQGYTSFVLYKTPEFTSDGNFEGGLKVGYATDNYEIAGFVRNITDERNLIGVIENYMAGVYNEPRVFGVSVSGRFR
ncbi:TonB-dependent receptor [Sphingobium nicotianae]|uniref:TonB-dependent receptor n=1 Tax=Sphingobium nicotianae TaxID=2782607 RepID=A0A9X1DDT4_9SPHN|nr:TonB-dependent receptor [Sphingobium nicotianae]MBT2188064.1 TonB-dependent receptor [Sphingobium nicotianae]